MPNPTKPLLSLVFVALVGACASDTDDRLGRAGASAQIDSVEGRIDAEAARLGATPQSGRPANMRVREGVFLGRDGFRTGRGDPLPRRLEEPDSIRMELGDSVTIADFVPLLQDVTGIRVDIRDLQTGTTQSSDTGTGTAGTIGTADSTGAGDTTTAASNDPNAAAGPMGAHFRVDHEGPLSSLLDHVARQIGADWEYRGGRIKFLGPQTRTYTIRALPGEMIARNTVGGGGSGEAFGSSGGGTVDREASYDYWQDIDSGLGAIVPGGEARYAINRSTGTVTVTGFQAIHERVADFIENENARLSRQVSVRVDVLAFSGEDGDRRGADLGLALENAAAGLGIEVLGAGAPIDGSTDLGVTILDKDSGPLENLTGSSGLIQALARQGRLSILNSTSVVATNNQPTPVAIANERAYLSGTSTTTDSEGNTTEELETGIVNAGMTMTITPRVMSSGEVMITYNMTLNELLGLETYAGEGSTVQLPEIETRNFMQTVSMGSGDSLVIAAFDKQRTSRKATGPFDPGFWGLGGDDSYGDENTKIVVIMSPVVLEASNTPGARR